VLARTFEQLADTFILAIVTVLRARGGSSIPIAPPRELSSLVCLPGLSGGSGRSSSLRRSASWERHRRSCEPLATVAVIGVILAGSGVLLRTWQSRPEIARRPKGDRRSRLLPRSASVLCLRLPAPGRTPPPAGVCATTVNYCAELVPTPGYYRAAAVLELEPVPSPFDVAVTRDGNPR